MRVRLSASDFGDRFFFSIWWRVKWSIGLRGQEVLETWGGV